MTTDSAHWLSQRARRTSEPQISVMLSKVLADPSIISLAAGFVDQKSLPAEMVREVLEDSVFAEGDIARKALQYGSTNGLAELREAVVPRLEAGGIAGPVDPGHIVLTSGSQQLLYLITDVLVDPGDIVFVEDPTYFVYMGVLEGAGARTLGVATDDDGMIPQALEERLEEVGRAGELHRVKLLYLMTYFQNPKGTSHSWKRREQLYEIIERHSSDENFIHILEDAAYFELKFEGEDVPFMKKLDPKNERVLLAMTFSKGFAPGMRLGYGHLPARDGGAGAKPEGQPRLRQQQLRPAHRQLRPAQRGCSTGTARRCASATAPSAT